SIIHKILFHSKVVTKYPQVNKGLLQKAREEKPDVIWVFKGMEIYPDTLAQLRKEGFKLANFNPDHPFIITSKGSGNKNVVDSVGLYDLFFCYQRELQREIEKRFSIPTVFLPFAYDTGDLTYADPQSVNEISRLCFQGNPDPYRAKMIGFLADAGISVDVYGHGWDKTPVMYNKGINIFPIATRKQFWYKNQEYRVQLNLFREYNFGSHNMRTFEIPVVGGIQLSTYSEEQAEFFKEGEEIFFFRDPGDLVQKTKALLALPKEEADLLRQKARNRSLVSGYSFEDRAKTVMAAFKQLSRETE
ncbi:MAG TPA: glycosyltransferase, partial [Chitinophagaceae bacterium]